MFARKGIVAIAAASSRSNLITPIKHRDQSGVLSTRISRYFSSTLPKPASQAPDPTSRVPRPIPLDIGNGPMASSFYEPSMSATATAAAAAGTGSTKRSYRSSGSIFDRFGGPIINVIIYSTTASLAVHLLYHYLALEEYKISSNKKIADLEAEIASIKTSQQQLSHAVKHPLGGRGEFV